MKSSYRLLIYAAVCSTIACSNHDPRYPWLALRTLGRTQVMLSHEGLKQRTLALDHSQLKFVEIDPPDATPINTEGDNDPPRGKNTPWVMVHGIGGSMGDLAPLLPIHPTQRIFLVNLPGYGGSVSENANYTIDGAIRALEQFVHHIGIHKAHFICHSLGGQACIGLLLKEPELAKSLTLISPSGIYDIAKLIRDVHEGFAGINAGRAPNIIAWIFHHTRRGVDYAPLMWLVGHDPKRSAVWSVIRDTFRSRLHELKMPTLIVWGINDPLFPVQDAFYLHQQIVHSTMRLANIENHSPQMTNPHLVAGWVHHFIHVIDTTGKMP